LEDLNTLEAISNVQDEQLKIRQKRPESDDILFLDYDAGDAKDAEIQNIINVRSGGYHI